MAYRATRAYIEAFIGALSNRTDIKFVEGNGFGVSLKDKTFMYDPVTLQQATIDEVKGILIHEVGHLNYTTDVPDGEESEEYKKYPCLSDLYNACEDIRIEHLMIKEFGNFADGPIGESRLYAAFNNYETVRAGVSPNMTGYKAFGGSLMTGFCMEDSRPLSNLTGDYSYLPFYNSIHSYSEAIYDYMRKFKSKEMKEKDLEAYFKKMKDFDWFIKSIDKCKNTIEVMALVDKEIVPHIRDLLEFQEEKNKAEGKMAQALHGAIKKMKEKMDAEEKKAEKAKEGEEFKNSRSMLDDLITGSKTGKKYRKADLPTDPELEQLYKMHIRALTKHLNSILEERTTIKYAGAYKRGKLLPRNVYKAKTNESRMYSKRKHFDTPSYEVTFIMDESGSMGSEGEDGGRYENIYTAGYVINRAVQALRFKINYISFDDNVRDHKEFAKMRDFRGGGNNEDKVLRHAEKKLNYKNDQIIFLLTDGGVDSDNSPTPMLTKFKKLGVHVIPIGIGIPESQAREFRQWYPESVLVKGMDDLVKTMSDFLKTVIHR